VAKIDPAFQREWDLASRYAWKVSRRPPESPTDEETDAMDRYVRRQARLIPGLTEEEVDDLVNEFILKLYLKDWDPSWTESKIWVSITYPKIGLLPISLQRYREHPEWKGQTVCQMVEAVSEAQPEDIIDPATEKNPTRHLVEIGGVSPRPKKD
jgi:hypothetical protein